MNYSWINRRSLPACRKNPRPKAMTLAPGGLKRLGVLLVMILIAMAPLGWNSSQHHDQSKTSPVMEQQKRESSNMEEANALIQTSDRGFALLGYAGTGPSPSKGTKDMWLIKTDSSGIIQWNRTYGKIKNDLGYALFQTEDNGFLLLGGKAPNNAILWPMDITLTKIDARGKMEWNRTYGKAETHDLPITLIRTMDGNFVLASSTASYEKEYKYWNWDMCLIKIDPDGNILWTKTYGKLLVFDRANALIQTADGGFAFAGTICSFEGEYSGQSDWIWQSDWILMKTDRDGNSLWIQTYNRTQWDWTGAVVQTRDGGFGLAGLCHLDTCLVKTDTNGTPQWTQDYGKIANYKEPVLLHTTDGGYVIACHTMLKINASGKSQWGLSFEQGKCTALIQTADGGIALAGSYRGKMWFLKADISGKVQWTKTFGGAYVRTNTTTTQNKNTVTGSKDASSAGFASLLIAMAALISWRKRK